MCERKDFLPLLQSLPNKLTRLFVTSRSDKDDIYLIFFSAAQIVIAAPQSEIERLVKEKLEERVDFMEGMTPEKQGQIITTISVASAM